ncbi:MAG: isoamylase early set domain-containing protein, partial [Gemmatimonadaceae bacterium]|nr:isoamylase early set domain-containing protein [Gemmatimonadaceae bacterium]
PPPATRERVSRRSRSARTWVAAGALAATLLAAVVLVGRDRADPMSDVSPDGSLERLPAVATAPGLGSATLAVDAGRSRSGVRLVQFVFRSPSARRVSVVGDFTGWKAGTLVMTRDSVSGFWSASMALHPGRHVYAFLMDDTVWVRDPRAPAAPDADFGRPGSILLVPQP